jgi:hypothetical protein
MRGTKRYVAFIHPFYRGARVNRDPGSSLDPLISSERRCNEHAERWKARFHNDLAAHHVNIKVLPLKDYMAGDYR